VISPSEEGDVPLSGYPGPGRPGNPPEQPGGGLALATDHSTRRAAGWCAAGALLVRCCRGEPLEAKHAP